MQSESVASNIWRSLSAECGAAIEKAGKSIVAVHGRRRIPSSGVLWRPGIIVTAFHSLESREEVKLTLPGGKPAGAAFAGGDPSTDLAILRVSAGDLEVAQPADPSSLKAGSVVLAAARTSEGADRASLAVIGVVGPASRTWRGGALDQTIRLDRNLHPNFSGGPAIDDQGRVLGIDTAAFSRYASIVIPVQTVDRVVGELEKKGHIGRAYLGVGLQPVRLPARLRESAKAGETGVMIVSVESDSPADKAGVTIGDVVLEMDGTPIRDVDEVQAYLTSDRVGKPLTVSILRGGARSEVIVSVGERPSAA